MAACVKYLGHDVPVGQIVFVRGSIALATLVTLAYFTDGLQVLKTSNPQRHALRSLSGTVGMYCLYAALPMIPLAEVTAINYSAPLFITVLAMVFLGERIHAFRWTALAIGFSGVLVMIGPHLSFKDSSWLGVTVALGAAITSAMAMIFLRSMSRGEPAITITFYFLLTATLSSLITLFWGWVVPTKEQWIVLLLTGLFGVWGQLTMTYSYRFAEASTVAPLDYSAVIFSMIIGRLFFDETPSWSVWIGAPLVVGAGILIFFREYWLAQRLRADSQAAAQVTSV